MTHHQIKVSPEVYQIAEEAAKRNGVPLEAWIAATISRAGTPVLADKEADSRSLSEALSGLIGVVDSREEPPYKPHRSVVGDIIAEKFKKQGIGARNGNSD